uniref:Zinc finger Ran-binding domain-containing protein 2 n=2 Tax=Elaeis guineensis var. tenera TaxID=51953 RepID=A0A6I9REB5_ELAGV|nr:zinc finger Ran-binding domain-containing protein 2 [Elaeis guineensis]
MFVHVSMQEDYVRSRENMERKPGDWNCRSCQYVNFCRRDSCQRCGEPKLGVDRPDYTSISGVWDVKPGDWYCSCGVHNYASRSNCFKCGAAKDDSTAAVAHSWGFGYGAPAGWKSGDWICTRFGCNKHNYASRTECYWCNAPKDHGAGYQGENCNR